MWVASFLLFFGIMPKARQGPTLLPSGSSYVYLVALFSGVLILHAGSGPFFVTYQWFDASFISTLMGALLGSGSTQCGSSYMIAVFSASRLSFTSYGIGMFVEVSSLKVI